MLVGKSEPLDSLRTLGFTFPAQASSSRLQRTPWKSSPRSGAKPAVTSTSSRRRRPSRRSSGRPCRRERSSCWGSNPIFTPSRRTRSDWRAAPLRCRRDNGRYPPRRRRSWGSGCGVARSRRSGLVTSTTGCVSACRRASRAACSSGHWSATASPSESSSSWRSRGGRSPRPTGTWSASSSSPSPWRSRTTTACTSCGRCAKRPRPTGRAC